MATRSGAVNARVIRAYEESFDDLGPTRRALGPRRLGEAPQRPHAAAALDGERAGGAAPGARDHRRHYQGINMRAAHARTQLFFLPFVLALILGALLVVSLTIDPIRLDSGRESVMSRPGLLVWIFALGGLGSTLSVALGAIRGVTKHSYRLLTGLRTNVTRLLLGAASAAAVVAVLETELLNAGWTSRTRASSWPWPSRPASSIAVESRRRM